MKTKLLPAFLLVSFLLTLFVSCSRDGRRHDQTVGVRPEDPEMVAAIAKARSLLPEFWRIYDHPEHGETDFCLKVKLAHKDQVEHFWVSDLERANGTVFGKINNDPEFVKTVKLGQRIQIIEADISDWLYMRDRKMHGNYTARALFKQMSPKEVETYKKMLADP